MALQNSRHFGRAEMYRPAVWLLVVVDGDGCLYLLTK